MRLPAAPAQPLRRPRAARGAGLAARRRLERRAPARSAGPRRRPLHAVERSLPPGLAPADRTSCGRSASASTGWSRFGRGRARGARRADRRRGTTTTSPAWPSPTATPLRERAQAGRAWRASTRRCAGPTCRASCEFVDAQAGAEARESEARDADEEGGDAVRLMTIHAAKGLEFPVVVVADCGRAGRRAARGDHRAAGRALRVPGARRDRPLPRPHRLPQRAAGRAGGHAEEQRRVLYVADDPRRRPPPGVRRLGAGSRRSPLGWIVEGLGSRPRSHRHGRARGARAAGRRRVLVHVRRPVAGGEPRRTARHRRPSVAAHACSARATCAGGPARRPPAAAPRRSRRSRWLRPTSPCASRSARGAP